MDVRKKLKRLLMQKGFGVEGATIATDHLIANGVTVQEWISVEDDNPNEPGEYTVAQKHWCDGHLESKKGKWNGVEWFVDGRESLMVAYWMPQLPLPQPPKGE